MVATDRFFRGMPFGAANPANAGAVVAGGAGQDTLVVELSNPRYDTTTQTATYDATPLADYRREGLRYLKARQNVDRLPAAFGATSLFIDDCPDLTSCVWTTPPGGHPNEVLGPLPGGPIGTCWHTSSFSCQPCDGQSLAYYDGVCGGAYAQCTQAGNGNECVASNL
jgi:hypothetical protein